MTTRKIKVRSRKGKTFMRTISVKAQEAGNFARRHKGKIAAAALLAGAAIYAASHKKRTPSIGTPPPNFHWSSRRHYSPAGQQAADSGYWNRVTDTLRGVRNVTNRAPLAFGSGAQTPSEAAHIEDIHKTHHPGSAAHLRALSDHLRQVAERHYREGNYHAANEARSDSRAHAESAARIERPHRANPPSFTGTKKRTRKRSK